MKVVGLAIATALTGGARRSSSSHFAAFHSAIIAPCAARLLLGPPDQAEATKRYGLAAQLFKQAAEEMGGAYSGRREVRKAPRADRPGDEQLGLLEKD
jgi:hypothetical protein